MTTKKNLANPVLMSIAAAVSYTSSQLKGFQLVARVGGGFIDDNTFAQTDRCLA